MEKFVVIYLVVAFLVWYQTFFKWNNARKSFVISTIAAFITNTIVGLRPLDAGFDTEPYVNYYNSLKGESIFTFNEVYSYNFGGEYLFKLWNFILSSLNLDASSFIYITSLVSIFLFLRGLQKMFGEKYLLVFLIFFATPGFVMLFGNGVRQGLAISFFLFAIRHFIDRKWIKMVLSALFVIFIHQTTGLILVVSLVAMLFLPKIVEKYRNITIILFLFLQPFAGYLREVIYYFYPSGYLTGDIGSAYFFHYSYIIFLFLLLVYSYSIKVKGEYMNKLFNFYIILTLIPSLIWYSSVAYGRIIYLSFPFMSFFLVSLGDKFKEKWLEFLLVVVMLSVGIYFYSTSSMQATLTDNQLHEFYNISLFEPIKNTLT